MLMEGNDYVVITSVNKSVHIRRLLGCEIGSSWGVVVMLEEVKGAAG